METAPSAPAQPASTDSNPGPGLSAPVAPARIDTGSYLKDRQAQAADPTKPAAEPVKAAEPVAPAVSKRQERINDYERTIAAQNERIARLEGRMEATPAAPAPPAAEKPVTQAEYKRYLALPDAPKIEDFESIPEFSAAMGVFIADQRWDDRTRAAAARSDADALTESQRTRADSFAGRIKKTTTDDPAFWDAISPDVSGLRPLADLKPGEQAGPRNLVAEELLSSPVAPQLMRELSKPGALARLEAGPEHLKSLPPAQRVQEHARWIIREIGRLEAAHAPTEKPAADVKLLTDNPPPQERLGRKPNVPDDPVEAAIKRKDTGSYLEARRTQEAAKLRR